jgi:hypothetical protein
MSKRILVVEDQEDNRRIVRDLPGGHPHARPHSGRYCDRHYQPPIQCYILDLNDLL